MSSDGKVFFLDQKFENAIFFGTWISSFFIIFTSRNGLRCPCDIDERREEVRMTVKADHRSVFRLASVV